eukprot:PRCOL_00005774-RA
MDFELDDLAAKREEAAAAVVLHVYDVTNMTEEMNGYVRSVNTFVFDQLGYGGVFHGAVEVYGREWSFGYCPKGSGVYAVRPKENPDYTYRQSVELGATALDEQAVHAKLRQLMHDWPGSSYDTLKRNCCHFCEDLADALGVPRPPEWLNKLARGGSSIVDTVGPIVEAVGTWWSALTRSLPEYRPPEGSDGRLAPVPSAVASGGAPDCEGSPERARLPKAAASEPAPGGGRGPPTAADGAPAEQ